MILRKTTKTITVTNTTLIAIPTKTTTTIITTMTNLTTTTHPIEEMRTTKPTITTEFPTGSTSGN